MAFTHLPFRRSIPLGIGAYLLGYVLTFLITIGRTASVMAIEIPGRYANTAPLGQILDTTPADSVVAGWFYYNAHLVPTSLPSPDASNGLSIFANYNLINELNGILLVLYLIPSLLLIGVGYLTVRTGTTHGVNGARNAGASVGFGYFPLFLIGAFLFTARATEASASPDGLQTVFIGLLYIGIFGAIGGVLAEKRANSAKASEE